MYICALAFDLLTIFLEAHLYKFYCVQILTALEHTQGTVMLMHQEFYYSVHLNSCMQAP